MATAVALLACASPAETDAQAVVPPSAGDIVVDGVANPSEWVDALRLGEDGVGLLVQQRDGVVEIALITAPILVASLCFERGDEVHILHSSSAVGSGTYRRAGDIWQLVRPFEWRLRGTDAGPAALEEQREHMERFGWVASTTVAGEPGETEFRISSRFLEDETMTFALGLLLEDDGPAVAGWPNGAEDDGCTQRTTIAGPLSEHVTFEPGTWVRLTLRSVGR